jgi:hypothetical protein
MKACVMNKSPWVLMLFLLSPAALGAFDTHPVWGTAKDKLMAAHQLKEEDTQKQIYLSNESINLDGILLTPYFHFTARGLAAIQYKANVKKEEVKTACEQMHQTLVKKYGQARNQIIEGNYIENGVKVHVHENYTWQTNKATIEQVCYGSEVEGQMTVTFYPHWQEFDCVIRDKHGNIEGKASYFFDDWNNRFRQFGDKSHENVDFTAILTPDKIDFVTEGITGNINRNNNKLWLIVEKDTGQDKYSGTCTKK